MKLSKLVYLCVKNVILYDDESFSYDGFIKGKFNGNPDYATSINNVFSAINQAISRLSDLERLPYRVEEVTLEDYAFNISDLEHNLKEIVAIAYIDSYKNITPLTFEIVGNQVIVKGVVSNAKVHVEYKEDIFFIQGESYYYEYTVNELGEDTLITSKDIELRDLGINDQMCNAIVEYAKGVLNEGVETALANMHITRAEQYFVNINPVRSGLSQTVVVKKWGVND